jgi:hypothetical protein
MKVRQMRRSFVSECNECDRDGWIFLYGSEQSQMVRCAVVAGVYD